MRGIDLFAGIGGFRLAMETAGIRSVWSCEIDDFARETYYANFAEYPATDIRAVDPQLIPNHDLLCAGFPCQPFSISGVSKKNALGRPHGFEDTEGTLFFHIAEILDAKLPPGFVLENVKNIQHHDGGKTFRIIMRTLAALGYEAIAINTNSRRFVPQARERVFIVGFQDPQLVPIFLDAYEAGGPQGMDPRLDSILEPAAEIPDTYGLSGSLWKYLQDYKDRHRKAGHGFGFGLFGPADVARTLSARYGKDGSEILIERPGKATPRRLTPRECARLMGFPDSFEITCSDAQAYRQFGNSVVVPQVAQVLTAAKASLLRRTEAMQTDPECHKTSKSLPEKPLQGPKTA